ncbi:MAG: serine/threonine protein kinase, partial [Acidobacteria bacterium]|nr:serine/threonine protein kinase [Acidobacteriota bacterium]
MEAERWRTIKELLYQALELEGDSRDSFLGEACAGDPSLLQEVESLLASHRAAREFLEPPSREEPPTTLPEGRDRDPQPSARRIGAYLVEQELGRGGMGTVYLGRRDDPEYRHPVALKVVARAGGSEAASEEISRRFDDERRILTRLDHPNIARILDGGTTEDGQPYFVMEYIEGLPIDRYCDAQRLTLAQRLELFRKVCAAVHFAHQNLVVHRDLKPGNILVSPGGTVKLLDFGIAKILLPTGADTELTATVQRRLTPAYASPEQLEGGAITTASDVYSLGVLLYQLLTGRRP